MKLSIIATLVLASVLAHANSESLMGTSKKEVVIEPGPEKLIKARAQGDLATFVTTGVLSAQAATALQVIAEEKGVTIETEAQAKQLALDSIIENQSK